MRREPDTYEARRLADRGLVLDRRIYVAFTMDCERIASESPPGGPETWELSERAIEGFCKTLLERDILPTLFLTPECGKRHAALLKELGSRGVELGLHLHPQSLGDRRHQKYFGEYSYAEQGDLVRTGTQALARAVGTRPRSFRPGNFSASKHTYPLLVDLGFRQGSVSDPGRNSPQYAAVWTSAFPDPHWASADDRLQPGGLPFLEVPVTTDPDRRWPNGFPYELRIESGQFRPYQMSIIDRLLNRVAAESIDFPCVCLFTHNYFEYGDPAADQSRTLASLLDYLELLAGRYQVTAASLPKIRECYAQTLGEPQC